MTSRIVAIVLLMAAATAEAQSLEMLHSFRTQLHDPQSLWQDTDGTIYGVARAGGYSWSGGLFKRTPDGTLTVLHYFTVADGQTPMGVIRASDGALYGTTAYGGAHGQGTLFRWQAGVLTTLHAFSCSAGGCWPYAGLVEGSDGALYGTTLWGGPGFGTIFKWHNGELTTLHTFSSADGSYPYAALTRGRDGALYGTTSGGGAANVGTIFRWQAGQLTTLYAFTTAGPHRPYTSVVEGADGSLYGTTAAHSISWRGALYRWNNGFATLHVFSGGSDGYGPYGGVTTGPDGALYGNTNGGGGDGRTGTVYRWKDWTFQTLHAFSETDGGSPNAAPLAAMDGRLYVATSYGGRSEAGVLARLDLDGDPFEVLHDFGHLEPRYPGGAIVHAADGRIYGATSSGGHANRGTLYALQNGSLTVLHSFDEGQDGAYPDPGLVADRAGVLYGVTLAGGAGGGGTFFKLQSDTFAVLHSFDMAREGYWPRSGLTVATDGAIYGLTSYGGPRGAGTLFRWDGSALTVLHAFVGAVDGYPSGRLFEGRDGALYGTTCWGAGDGSIFKWKDGMLSTVHVFSGADGSCPNAGVVEGRDGALYGTTLLGGTRGSGTLFKYDDQGLTTLHAFDDVQTSSFLPLIAHSDGAIYGGREAYGSSQGFGTLFRWNGSFTVLHTFTLFDGAYPSHFSEGPDGSLYGSAWDGGPEGAGVVFRLRFSKSTTLAASGTGTYRGVATLAAALTSGGDAVAGKRITFSLHGADVGSAVTDARGVAELTIPVASESAGLQAGVVAARFAGDASHDPSGASGDLALAYASSGACLDGPGHAILPPVRADGSSVFRSGSTVSLKFRVCDATGRSVGDAGVVAAFRLGSVVSGTVVAEVNEPVDSTSSHDQFRWDALAQQWVFMLSTKSLDPNATYHYVITLADGSEIPFRFGVR